MKSGKTPRSGDEPKSEKESKQELLKQVKETKQMRETKRVDVSGPLRSWLNGFGYAYEGIVRTIVTQRNMRIQMGAAVLACLAALFLRLSPSGAIMLLLTIAAVLAAELINTAVEHAVDLATPERHPLAKAAKDAAAGAVLALSLAAVAVAAYTLREPAAQWLAGARPPGPAAAAWAFAPCALTLALAALLALAAEAASLARGARLRVNAAAAILFAAAAYYALAAAGAYAAAAGGFAAACAAAALLALAGVPLAPLVSGAMFGILVGGLSYAWILYV